MLIKTHNFVTRAIAFATLVATTSVAFADSYDNVWIECTYITQCSMSAANTTVGSISQSSDGYGALNDWRIGNGMADSVDCGTQGIGAVGLLYGYARLTGAGRSNSTLDTEAKTATLAFFTKWITNSGNHLVQSGGQIGFPATASYNTSGNYVSEGAASVPVTAQLLIAMRKYCQLSPNGDRSSYQSNQYALAHHMADFINAYLSTWTVDRSYAVAAFTGFSHWATAVGDTGTASYYANQASIISGDLASAQDLGSFHNYYDYLNGSGQGVYNNSNVDQTGFAPYEFNARSQGESYAALVAQWWDYGTAFDSDYLTVQSGTYAGGVHQSVPSLATNAYPGDSFQLADAEWKIAHANGNLNNQYAQAWWHYNFALSPIGSSSGSGCWVNNTSVDGFIGGFIDWVNTTGGRPASWQRFIDTSGYMIVATEELEFSNEVDWSY
jgi:hypothetical protein